MAGCASGYNPVHNPLGPVPGAKPANLQPVIAVVPYSVGGGNPAVGYLRVDTPPGRGVRRIRAVLSPPELHIVAPRPRVGSPGKEPRECGG